jgi:hypothetical protein
LSSLPIVRVCHRTQTSIIVEDGETQPEQFSSDRQRLINNFLGIDAESDATRELKERHSGWEANAIDTFISKMNMNESTDATCTSLAADEGVALMEGHLRRRSKIGWKTRWYVMTGGGRVPGMLRYGGRGATRYRGCGGTDM